MPFHDRVYYPYTSDTQGTHSSAGIPSLLNSPLSQHSVNGHSVPAAGMTPSSGASTFLPFKFRPRRESVDWRRINAVDIDLVVSQLDVDILQEHISMVTFCSLDGERCQRCQSPVDPALVKLLQLAQLTVEWLLHCQEFLTLNLRAAEERLAAGGREREQLLAQQNKQEEKVKALTNELKQRKKVIRTQQSLLAPRIISSQKCPHCDKSFLNSSFLQNHMQRRHPDEYEIQLRSDSEKKSQIESLKLEISNLKEQIVQQQQDLQAKIAQEKEQQSVHKAVLRELDRFKAEEMARMDRKIEDSRDGMRREMEFLYTRNIQALNEANQNQTAKHEKSVSPVQSQPERDVDIYKEMQIQAIQKLEYQMKKQDKKWESRLQEIKAQHESEKNQLLNELSRMQSSLSEHQEQSQRLQQEMGRRLQEKEQTIKAQREQIRNISSNPPTKVVEIPVMVSAPAPEPKPKRVVLEEPVFALNLDPIQELSEEEKDSSSISERRPVEKKPEPVPEKKQRATTSALKRNPNIKREMRPELEQAVIKKLENLGVKADQSGLKNKELTSMLAKVHSKRESVAKGMPDYWQHWEEIASTVDQKLGGQMRGSNPASESQARSRQSVQVLQIRPRSSSLPSRATQSGPAVKQPKTPQPAPRTKSTTQPKTSTPNTKTALRTFTTKTPPFSSDEDSEEEVTDMEEEQPQKQQRGKSPQSRLNQATSVQIKASKASPVQARQAAPRHSFSSNPQQFHGSVGVTKTAVTNMSDDDEDEWSEVSELQEIDPRQLQGYKDQNGNVDKRNFGKENKINVLARKMEKQFAERAVKKPAGGVSVLPERNDEVQDLTYTDLEESSEWVVSSLEDKQEMSKPAQGSGPLRKSLDSPSTSVWGTSTGKGPKSAGLTEAGTGSTLKSSLCSLSDISDSEDISNKHSKHYS
ncbi:cilium assembly protein DZIP1 isoform X1 [Lates calcarifer]|uniref:Cilium assembly protein DZIP1 isoform X1 n=2 Tax=Lates calcarifer TaxID=8187 RepID=A0AAJ7PIX1_LATCA|nr:cilium assembly protein DZIP1 isoform X1 [Lates calcarifer]XP_018527125.1 cilium assembly protein DZIP1 isoform X1 [Lates calcarifer]XP_018527126.1 cilium assembly protein DZIP1 isoform X1 [Lates calcarifer]